MPKLPLYLVSHPKKMLNTLNIKGKTIILET